MRSEGTTLGPDMNLRRLLLLTTLAPSTFVVGVVAQGKTNREIGEELFISQSTAKYHLRNILDKLHLENRAQVVAYATRRGLDRRVDDPERS